MYQTQQPQLTQKAILQAIQRQLLILVTRRERLQTLATEICSKRYLVIRRSLSFFTMNPRIENKITPIGGASQTLLRTETEEVIADTACGGAWVNRNPGKVRRTGVNRITLATLVWM